MEAKQGLKNVNVAQGPRKGNEAARTNKREEMKAAKEDRAPLADMIANAFTKRAPDERVNPKLEGIQPNSGKLKYRK